MIITSKDNAIFKKAMSLHEKKHRDSLALCLVEGDKIIEELETEFVFEKGRNISEQLFEKLAQTKTSQNKIAIVKIKPGNKTNLGKFVVCDGVQDSGNLGTVIRSALAFNFNSIVLVGACADPFSLKTIRSSVGAVFNINIVSLMVEQVAALNTPLISCNLNGINANKFNYKQSGNFGIVLGSEGQGVSRAMQNICTSTITIATNKKIESLNVAVAGSIIMQKFSEVN